MFQGRVSAQGGHFRNAVFGCAGPLHVGLEPNDTRSTAKLSFDGEVEIAQGDARENGSLLLSWQGMPPEARYRLAQSVTWLPMDGSGNWEFDAPLSPERPLRLNLEVPLTCTAIGGGSCSQEMRASASLAPAE